MKLIHAVTSHIHRVALHFGEAKLIRVANSRSRYELIGGTTSDLVAAKEWISLFAHEMVLSHSRRKPKQVCPVQRHSIPPVFKLQRAGFFQQKSSSRIKF